MIYDREMTSPPTGTDKSATMSSHKATSSTGSYLGLCVPLEYDTMYKVCVCVCVCSVCVRVRV